MRTVVDRARLRADVFVTTEDDQPLTLSGRPASGSLQAWCNGLRITEVAGVDGDGLLRLGCLRAGDDVLVSYLPAAP